jgi:protoporphyrinogen oxidase
MNHISSDNPERTTGEGSLRGTRAVVIGGGIAGLTAAYALTRRGAAVTLLERRPELGGLARSEMLAGELREVYYHFICADDYPLLRLISELELTDALEWTPARTSYFVAGRRYPFTTPLDILRFPPLALRDRLRFGLHAARCRRMTDWRPLEELTAEQWLRREVGDRAYEVIWQPLLRTKFGRYAGQVSAPWIWHRLYRASRSRPSLLRPERFGVLAQGSRMLLEALAERSAERGGEIRRGQEATGLVVRGGRVVAVATEQGELAADLVISALPLPELVRLLPEQAAAFRAQLAEVDFLGVSCLLLLLRRPLTDQYWINIADERVPASGIIEYSNLNRHAAPGGALAYMPLYTPTDDPHYRRPPAALTEELVTGLRMVIPDLQPADVTATLLSRDDYAQAVTPPGFSRKIPPLRTPVEGLFLLDSTQLYPSDRCLSGMIGLARGLVEGL